MSDHPQFDKSDLPAYDSVLVDITDYVFNSDISSVQAWQRAKIALFDAVGCALETLKECPESRAIIGPVVEGTEVPNGFKLPGTTFQMDPVKGAFDLATLIRYLDHNDAFPGAEWGHPSDNLGAILAVCDWLSRTACTTGAPSVSMEAVLQAMIKAYEIQGCFQIRNAFNKLGIDHTILVVVASTAVVAHLVGCTEQQTLAALSHAFIDAGPLRIFRQSPNTGPRKGWAAGDACMRAVRLALMAKHGQPGAPTVLTDPKWGFYTNVMQGRQFELPRPFGSWVMENVFFKIHAAEGHAASAVEAALLLSKTLRTRHFDIGLEEAITHIRVRTQEPAMIIINKHGKLTNAADRDHCMQYMIAVVLLKGSMLTSRDYNDDSPWASDPRVDVLRNKIELVEDEQFTADYHSDTKRSAANALQITLFHHERLREVVVEYPSGHPWRDDTPELVKQKIISNIQGWFRPETSREIQRLIDTGVEEFCQMEVRAFVDKLAGGGDAAVSETGEEEDVSESPSHHEFLGRKDMMTPSTKVEQLNQTLTNGTGEHLKAAINGGSLAVAGNSGEDQASIGKNIHADVEGSGTAINAGDMVAFKGQVSAAKGESMEQELHSRDQASSAPTNGHGDTKRAHSTQVLGLDHQDSNGASNNQDPVTSPAETHQAATDGNLADGDELKASGPQETYFAAFPHGKSPHPSPYVSYGLPFTQTCAKHVAETIQATRVYILVSGSLSESTEDLPRLHTAIDERCGQDTVVGIRRGVRPHTFYSDILRIVQEVTAANADCLVTLGGGSLTDAAKVAALAIANKATTFAELESLYFDSPTLRNPLLPATIPIVCIPTSLSAGEYTPIAGATDDSTQHKHSFQHLSMGPRLIILDPALTATTPLRVWLSTGVRAIDHCVESICSIQSSADGDVVAARGLHRLVPGLQRTKRDPAAAGPRLQCQLGALDAIAAPLSRVPMGASHGIGHQLGPLGVGHGETSCVLLPAVCKFNKGVNGEQQRAVMETLWGADISGNGAMDGIWTERMDLGDMLDALFKELGMPRSLRQVGVGREKWDGLAKGSLQDRWCRTNPVKLTEEGQVKQILELCE